MTRMGERVMRMVEGVMMTARGLMMMLLFFSCIRVLLLKKGRKLKSSKGLGTATERIEVTTSSVHRGLPCECSG